MRKPTAHRGYIGKFRMRQSRVLNGDVLTLGYVLVIIDMAVENDTCKGILKIEPYFHPLTGGLFENNSNITVPVLSLQLCGCGYYLIDFSESCSCCSFFKTWDCLQTKHVQ